MKARVCLIPELRVLAIYITNNTILNRQVVLLKKQSKMIARKRNLLLHSFVILSTLLVGAASRPQKYLRSLTNTICTTQPNSNPNSCWAKNNGGSNSCMYCSNDALCLDLNATRVEGDPSCTTSDPCRHQTANGVGFCRAFFGYKWDGDQCSPVEGCSCQGPDCDSISLELSECEATFQSCIPTPDPTAPEPDPLVVALTKPASPRGPGPESTVPSSGGPQLLLLAVRFWIW